MSGEVNNKKRGVNVAKGATIDKSAYFIDFIYNIVVVEFNKELTVIANQNVLFSSGISIKNRKGNNRGNEKKLNDQATMYSSIFLKPTLPATSVNDLNKAVSNAKIIQLIFIGLYTCKDDDF